MKNITFVNAGAGSGKTYHLTTELAKKLTMEGLDPSQVILTTYTELAAAEFREKARKEILKAPGADADVRIKNATQLDNAFIGTVHAISYRFIRKYWYLLDYGSDIQPMSEQNEDFYMSQSISNIATDEDRKVFKRFRDTFDIKDGYSHPNHLFWLPELKRIVDKMEYYEISDSDVKMCVDESMKTVKSVFNGRTRKELFACISSFLKGLKTYLEGLKPSDKQTRMLNTLNSLWDGENNSFRIRRVEDLLTGNDKEKLLDTVGSGNAKTQFYGQQIYTDALKAFDEAAISCDFVPVIEDYLNAIFDLANRWRKSLSEYKKANHIISFDDMEKIFLEMLTNPKYKVVQDDIESNFKLLMVDEFQDSNPVQLRIFNCISNLIEKNGGESVWVGDPKQAIYGFRGSDSTFIARILDKFEFSDNGDEVPRHGDDMLGTRQLTESWRSRPALVNFANNIFLDPFMNGGLKKMQVKLDPHYEKEEDTMGAEKALYKMIVKRNAKSFDANHLALKIKALLESGQKVHHEECDKATGDITYRDIAVLCYSNRSCKKIASALRKVGLPASCEESNLMQCLEVYLLRTLLLFIQNSSDKMIRAELKMLLEDATTVDVLKERIRYVGENRTDDRGWDKWMDNDLMVERLNAFAERYKMLSVYDTVVALREELDLDNIARKWGDSTQRKHNLGTVVSMAKAYEDMCEQMGVGSSIHGFINYLTITKPDNKTDNAANTIKVLTYHRSKGLEWPVVILYDLDHNFNDDMDIARKKFRGVNVCEVEGQTCDIFSLKHYIHLFPAGIGGSGNTKMSDLMLANIKKCPLYDVIENQTREEVLRLLYVGVTRAKDILFAVTDGTPDMCWPNSIGGGSDTENKPWENGFQGTDVFDVPDDFSQDEDEMTYQQTDNEPCINDASALWLSPSGIENFSNQFTGSEVLGEGKGRAIDMNMFKGEKSDAVKGSCIHNIFAVYSDCDVEGTLNRARTTLANYGFEKVTPKQVDGVINSIKWLYGFLTETYGPYTRVEKEYPLLYPLESGQILRGEIDLQWYYRDAEGKEKCVLVDYKTFPGKRDQLEEHTKRYFAQLSAYRTALTGSGVDVVDALIYYPVQMQLRRLV